MQFRFSDEQQMLRDGVDRFGAGEWPPERRLELLAESDGVTARNWAQIAELGWLLLPMSEEQGGIGGSAVDAMALTEGFGQHLLPLPFVTSCVLVAALIGGDEGEARTRLEETGAGLSRGAAALLEEDGGYDPAQVALTAMLVGGQWRLSGGKSHVEDGAGADWFLVSARTAGGALDRDGISLFLVPADADGLEVRRFRSVDGHRHAKLRLRDVSKAILVGTKDGALPVIEAAVDRAISAQLGEAVGSMERALQVTLDYLKARHQFGVPIGSFQVLQHRAVDMAVAVEEARSLAWRAALDLDDGAGAARTISAAKARVGQCGIYVARQAVQLHGGIGTSDEVIISHHLRRQMMLDVSHGDADYHLERFAST